MKRNPSFSTLCTNYLFPEITKRKKDFLTQNPTVKLISLGIGDTTEPLPQEVIQAMKCELDELGTHAGYKGYGPEQGVASLRQRIASKLYDQKVEATDVFISDGAKCDLGRLQTLFGPNCSIAVPDPAYPVYRDGSLIQGIANIVPMPCTPENNFFPDLDTLPRTDLVYFCSPNNPTGAIATRAQLEQLVAFVKRNRSILIFDAAYASYIQDPAYPKSIYEIEGAEEVAIEVGSFSKMAGFSGLRLGWTVVPQALRYEDGGSVRADWNRLISTVFNGASLLTQKGGEAVLDKGWQVIEQQRKYYLENVRLLEVALKALDLEVYTGGHAPYLWVRFKGQSSWDVFQMLLEKYHILTTPGVGFGNAGSEFVRFSAFANRSDILEAVTRLEVFVHS